MVDALTHVTEKGRRRLRKASASCQSSFEPGISEWGNLIAKKYRNYSILNT